VYGAKAQGPRTQSGKPPARVGGTVQNLQTKRKARQQTNKGNKRFDPGLVDRTGRMLDSKTIRNERRQGQEDAITGKQTLPPETMDPAFVSHTPRAGSKDFFVSPGPADIGPRGRTGRAVNIGMDAHPDRLVEQAARSRGLADAQKAWTEFVGQVAHRRGKKELAPFTNRKEAQKFIDNMSDEEAAREWVVVRLDALASNPEQTQVLLERVNGDMNEASTAFKQAFNEAIPERTPEANRSDKSPGGGGGRNAAAFERLQLRGLGDGVAEGEPAFPGCGAVDVSDVVRGQHH
jgi:hypothetical protein